MAGNRKQGTFSRLASAFWGESGAVELLECRDLHGEAAFGALLAVERKRTERTGRAFALTLIDVRRLVKEITEDGNSEAREGFATFVRLLMTNTRDIDVKGWYDDQRVVGIIWPETDGGGQVMLEQKLRRMLEESVGADFHSRLGVMWFSFPGDSPPRSGTAEQSRPFYPESDAAGRGSVQRALKRGLDIAGALMALAVFSPLLVVISVLIKMTSSGPVFFRQERIGADGKTFTFLKFRTMHVNCDQELHRRYVSRFIRGDVDGDERGNTGVYKITDDPRVTRIGRWLRRTSLDEIPQFFNVLAGHMALVGPRPPIPYEMSEYKLWHRRRVMAAKPGITGPWQVEARSATTFDGMVRMDIQYLRTWSLWSDIKLIAKTPLVLLVGRGAY